jgi:flavin reductase (DIM6/NTAB) family NADH-FMN oxidoreductase RutF
MQKLPLPKAFQLIEPGPVVLVTTVSGGKMNVMTISWHMVMDFTPRIALVTGPWNYSFQALRKNKECVIAIPKCQAMICFVVNDRHGIRVLA